RRRQERTSTANVENFLRSFSSTLPPRGVFQEYLYPANIHRIRSHKNSSLPRSVGAIHLLLNPKHRQEYIAEFLSPRSTRHVGDTHVDTFVGAVWNAVQQTSLRYLLPQHQHQRTSRYVSSVACR